MRRLIRISDLLWTWYTRAQRCAHYIKFWKIMLRKNGDFFDFFFLISKYKFLQWCNFLQNWCLQTLELYICYQKIFYDLRTKGTKYKILKKKLIFFFAQFLVIFADFCRLFQYLFFWDAYIARATPRANPICYVSIYMISNLTHEKFSMCTQKAHDFFKIIKYSDLGGYFLKWCWKKNFKKIPKKFKKISKNNFKKFQKNFKKKNSTNVGGKKFQKKFKIVF